MKLAIVAQREDHVENPNNTAEPKKDPHARELKVEDWLLDIRRFILTKYQFPPEEIDDIVQDVAHRILRKSVTNPYVPSRGSISTYLWWNIRSTVFLRMEERKTHPSNISYEEMFLEPFQPDRVRKIPLQTPLHDSTDRKNALRLAGRFHKFLRQVEGDARPKPSAVFKAMLEGHSLNEMVRNGWTDGDRIKVSTVEVAGMQPLRDTDVNLSKLKLAKRRIEALGTEFKKSCPDYGMEETW